MVAVPALWSHYDFRVDSSVNAQLCPVITYDSGELFPFERENFAVRISVRARNFFSLRKFLIRSNPVALGPEN